MFMAKIALKIRDSIENPRKMAGAVRFKPALHYIVFLEKFPD